VGNLSRDADQRIGADVPDAVEPPYGVLDYHSIGQAKPKGSGTWQITTTAIGVTKVIAKNARG
jgi:hypothetical protein